MLSINELILLQKSWVLGKLHDYVHLSVRQNVCFGVAKQDYSEKEIHLSSSANPQSDIFKPQDISQSSLEVKNSNTAHADMSE